MHTVILSSSCGDFKNNYAENDHKRFYKTITTISTTLVFIDLTSRVIFTWGILAHSIWSCPHAAHIAHNYHDANLDDTHMEWPAYSLDLNPIEQAWDMLGRAVSKVHPAQTTKEDLLLQLHPDSSDENHKSSAINEHKSA